MDLPHTPSFRLDGKRALIAGGSAGIGLGCATALAEAGAEVTLAARRADVLENAVSALRAKGFSAKGIALDIADLEAMRAALAPEPAFDILLNAAGTARHSATLETTAQDFDAVSAVNIRGAYFLAQITAAKLIEAGKPGSLIQISSQMGHVGGPERAVYCATKHAVEGMTKAMAIEWGPHQIRVNTLCPTFILTELTRPTFDDPDKRAWVESKILLGRVGAVSDIMGAAVYLASDASALVTGTALKVDGGWTAE